MQANLDLLLDWAHSNGLGEVAVEHMHTLSSAVNLLATPRKNLLQVTQKFMHPGAHLIYIFCSDRTGCGLRVYKKSTSIYTCA